MTVMNEVNNFASVTFGHCGKFEHFALDLGISRGAQDNYKYFSYIQRFILRLIIKYQGAVQSPNLLYYLNYKNKANLITAKNKQHKN